MSIEFGKDVISIDPEGVPCAFQLKGNPGSRLTLSQFREIKPQIDELVEQRIAYPGIPQIAHKCYLVTNGEIEEEVQRSVDDLNIGYTNRGFHPNTRLHLISRGILLDWAVKHASTFWPESYSVQEKLIKLYNEDGNSSINLDIITQGLDEILKLSTDVPKLSTLEVERRQISASLFVAFAIRNYLKEHNHIAVAGAYAALFVGLKCALQRHQTKKTRRNTISSETAREGFLAAAIDLADEFGGKVDQIEAARDPTDKDIDYNVAFLIGNPLSNHFLWRTRALTTAAILSLVDIEILRSPEKTLLSAQAQRAIKIFTKPGNVAFQIWGEGAIPQLLCLIWNWHNRDPTLKANFAEYQLLNILASDALSEAKGYIATPYHSDEDSIRDQIGSVLGLDRGPVEKETPKHSSYFAEQLFYCFVRSNLKSYAKALWPQITRLTHISFVPQNSYEYCLWRIDKGDNQTRFLERRQRWSDIQTKASNIATPNIPAGLREDPLMLLAFTVFFPHRALPEVISFLHLAICGTWFLPSSRPDR